MKLSQGAVRSTTSIGLDIGSTAVRAVELTRGRRGLSLVRFAQVGLPVGAVVDGEVREPGGVVVALRRLWSEGGFGSRSVVVCLSGQRVIVRQAEVPSMSESDLRSSLRYQASDLIPIPADTAILDFSLLPAQADEPGHMRILLGAAPRDVVESQLAVVREAGLRPTAVDPSPMAAARASRLASLGGQATAIVDVGGEVTVVVVREADCVRFSRIVSSGGSFFTERVAERLSVDLASAESLKRHHALTGAGPGSLEPADIDPLVSEIEGSLAFFTSQLDSGVLDEILVTGGPSRSPELVQELAGRLSAPLTPLDALAGIDSGGAGLDETGLWLARSSALLAVGAAEWAFDGAAQRLSLLPREFEAAAALRRQVAVAGLGLVVVAAGLGALSVRQSHRVSAARRATAAVTATNTRLAEQAAALSPISQAVAAVSARIAVLQGAERNDIAWTTLLDRLSAGMPAGATLKSLTFADASGGTGSTGTDGSSSTASSSSTAASASAAPTAGSGLGTITMTVSARGDLDQVAVWLRSLARISGLTAVWVPAADASGGTASFTSTASVSSQAPMVSRSDVQKVTP